MQTSGLDWIDDLPPELAGQQALLRGLLALCDADDRIRWLVIGCSLARGAGDRLSDLDMAMGIRDEGVRWPIWASTCAAGPRGRPWPG